jgi:hypothetical protein
MQAKQDASRREQRIKANLRASVSRFARTANPPARSRAVQILSISNVPSGILDAIDELAADQDRSRSSFIRHELQRVIAGYRAQAAQAL